MLHPMTAPVVTRELLDAPEPGLYPNVPADAYHRWPVASQRH